MCVCVRGLLNSNRLFLFCFDRRKIVAKEGRNVDCTRRPFGFRPLSVMNRQLNEWRLLLFSKIALN